jgi:acyl-CoA reductase-like NAD-dependent aldehyde dehydrogenase
MWVRQAFDGAAIAEVAVDDAESLTQKLERAIGCFADRSGWLPAYKRIEILRRLARLMERESDALAMLIAREGGKPLSDARVETARAINGVEGAVGELEHLAGREIPMGLTPASQDRWAFTIKEPIGVVAAISAFNHPLNLVVHQVVPAIATGCPVIIKPATSTPLSCLRFVELAHEAGLPPAWCQMLVVEDNALAERFATHPSIAFLSFIGSAKVGWYLRSKLPPGARCALEHGGAAPVIVDRSVEVDAAVGKGRLLSCGASVRVRAANFRSCGDNAAARRAADRTGAGAAGRRSYSAGYRGGAVDSSEGGRPSGGVGQRSGRFRRPPDDGRRAHQRPRIRADGHRRTLA